VAGGQWTARKLGATVCWARTLNTAWRRPCRLRLGDGETLSWHKARCHTMLLISFCGMMPRCGRPSRSRRPVSSKNQRQGWGAPGTVSRRFGTDCLDLRIECIGRNSLETYFPSYPRSASQQLNVEFCWRNPALTKPDLPGSALALLFCQARLHHLLHKSCWQRLVRREADRAFGCLEALQFILECLDHGHTRREQTAML
jgi:hypothetical protein